MLHMQEKACFFHFSNSNTINRLVFSQDCNIAFIDEKIYKKVKNIDSVLVCITNIHKTHVYAYI